ncbi:hypothetical protein ACYPKM_03135 [Pseudomonas aeruginosa]
MSEHNESTVLQFSAAHSNSQARTELDSVQSVLGLMGKGDWEMEVRQVLKLTGHLVDNKLLDYDLETIKGSTADQLGHKTVKALVTSAKANNGLAMNWDELHVKMCALVYKQRFELDPKLSYQEINSQVSDCAKVLGHTPSTMAEFYKTTQTTLMDVIKGLRRDAEAARSESKERLQTLMRELTEAQDSLSRLNVEKQRVVEESANLVTQKTREMAEAQERQDAEMNRKLEEAQRQSEQRVSQAREAVRVEMLSIVRGAEEATRLARADLESIQGKISNGELVPSSDLEVQKGRVKELEEAERLVKAQLMTVMEELKESKLESQRFQEHNAELKLANRNSAAQITSLETRYREMVEKGTNEASYSVLQDRLEIRRQENERLSTSLKSVTEENTGLKKTVSALKGRVSEARRALDEATKRWKQDVEDLNNQVSGEKVMKGQFKVALGVITALLAVTSIALGVSLL